MEQPRDAMAVRRRVAGCLPVDLESKVNYF